jgi:hypothetical protein
VAIARHRIQLMPVLILADVAILDDDHLAAAFTYVIGDEVMAAAETPHDQQIAGV